MGEIVRPLFERGVHLWTGRTGLFLRYAVASTIFVLVAAALRRLPPVRRAWGQVAASILLIAVLATPAVAALAVLHAAALYWLVERAPLGRARLLVVAPFVALQALAPMLWFSALPGYEGRVREFVAFATNMSMLRAWSYAYDRHAGRLPAAASPHDYALFTFFFPSFVNGTLLSLDEFCRNRLATYWDAAPQNTLRDGGAWRRVGMGFLALALVLPLDGTLGPEQYAAVAASGPFAAWRQAVFVYFGVYLGFSAWTEASLGFARLAGVVLPENFDAPLRSYGIADFWRRWNIRLGWWMRYYVYLPLGGGHPRGGDGLPLWRNVGAVFAATAIYHHLGGLKLLGTGLLAWPAFYTGWALWALYNTIGTIATRHMRAPAAWGARDVAIVVATFAFHCVALLTAFFPATMPLARLGDIYRHLLLLP